MCLYFRSELGGLPSDRLLLLQHVLLHLQNRTERHRREEQAAQRRGRGQQVFLHRVL